MTIATSQATDRTTVGILFGGRSSEHAISVITAAGVLQALDRGTYEPVLIGITRDGVWHLSDERELTATREADIITTCTRSRAPLVKGANLKPGTHLDLVGGFTPDTRESDDEAAQRSRIFVDRHESAFDGVGDIQIFGARETVDMPAPGETRPARWGPPRPSCSTRRCDCPRAPTSGSPDRSQDAKAMWKAPRSVCSPGASPRRSLRDVRSPRPRVRRLSAHYCRTSPATPWPKPTSR